MFLSLGTSTNSAGPVTEKIINSKTNHGCYNFLQGVSNHSKENEK